MRSFGVALAIVCVLGGAAGAQWFNYPTAGIPRTPDGKADLSAAAPKQADGKADLSGLWQPADILIGDLAKNLKPG